MTTNIYLEGIIEECLPNGMFKITSQGFTISSHLAGNLRRNSIKLVLGDKVIVKLDPYDLASGRIVYRYSS
jgi:translation initiation factor IF-1